jgi:hypothetical protein
MRKSALDPGRNTSLDPHGEYRGRYSSATIRGTIWSIADRCDGTLVRDATESVVVSDVVRHKTIVPHAGQSYLAKKPK